MLAEEQQGACEWKIQTKNPGDTELAIIPGAALADHRFRMARGWGMTFFESIKTVFRKYAEFGGRARRPEFWWFALFSVLVSAALNALSVPISGAAYGTGAMAGRMFGAGATSGAGGVYGYVSFASVWSIAVLLPSIAVTVRRLRDAGRNWSELFWLLLPMAGAIVLISCTSATRASRWMLRQRLSQRLRHRPLPRRPRPPLPHPPRPPPPRPLLHRLRPDDL